MSSSSVPPDHKGESTAGFGYIFRAPESCAKLFLLSKWKETIILQTSVTSALILSTSGANLQMPSCLSYPSAGCIMILHSTLFSCLDARLFPDSVLKYAAQKRFSDKGLQPTRGPLHGFSRAAHMFNILTFNTNFHLVLGPFFPHENGWCITGHSESPFRSMPSMQDFFLLLSTAVAMQLTAHAKQYGFLLYWCGNSTPSSMMGRSSYHPCFTWVFSN